MAILSLGYRSLHSCRAWIASKMKKGDSTTGMSERIFRIDT